MVIRWDMVMSASLALLLSAASAKAQSVAQVGQPAELPSASFTGQQYVDSRGCVFMRAGFSGRTTWVPRIGRDRKPICNEVTPAEAAARLNAPQGEGGVAAPVETVASAMGGGQSTGVFAPSAVPGLADAGGQGMLAKPRLVPAPAQPLAQAYLGQGQGYGAVGGMATAGRNAACPAIAPVLAYVALRTGGSVAVCTRGDGTADGWFSPKFKALGAGGGGQLQPAAWGQPASAQASAVQAALPPPGYAEAWDDDRLNPVRGLGTAQGWNSQSQVWANTTPGKTHAQLAAAKSKRAKAAGQTANPAAAVNYFAAPDAWAEAGGGGGGGQIYVQVGSFGNSANAQNAAGRLAGLGLPVARAQSQKRGKLLTLVMAGPFASVSEANRALQMARSVGFSDAYLR